MRRYLLFVLLAAQLLTIGPAAVQAQLVGPINFVVLRVSFSDFPAGSRFTAAQTQTNFNNIATLWGTDTSYGTINLHYQFAGPTQMPSPSTTYLDSGGGNSSSGSAIVQLVNDAVAASPTSINWNNVYGLVVVFSDTRSGGFYRGITNGTTLTISPPGGGSFTLHASIVGENPSEALTYAWGRMAHEMGHQMQSNPGNPWHPSNYNSDFEQMDREYPSQSGVFNKQSNMAYKNWLPAGKYKIVSPPAGTSVGLYAEEQPPGTEPDYQAVKAYLTFGGTQVYYLVSVRHHILGDDLATVHGPSGIPDEGVLIERVVEGGDPTIDDCAPGGCYRWVNVEGNGSADTLWHSGNTYHSTADGIYIVVGKSADADHYPVTVRYADTSGKPDIGIQSWLQPPGNTYETTDIWVDSPVNGYGTFRYGTWSDLLGGTVPQGNGDDPAVNQVNRLYARVRNYGNAPATGVVVHFDISNPPGVGVNSSTSWLPLGSVTSAQFPALASVAAGGQTDVYFPWTPNFTLTPAQIQQGIFFFHTCIRVRIDHVPGEVFFANQDGDGQQENIQYFQAGSSGSPGAHGAPNAGTFVLHNDSPVLTKEFEIGYLRDSLPASWKVTINGGVPVVKLAPGASRVIPVVIKQTAYEPVGSTHSIRVIAASEATLRNAAHPTDLHNEFKVAGGIQFHVAVLEKAKLTCSSPGGGKVAGMLTGLTGKEDKRFAVEVVGIAPDGRFTSTATYGFTGSKGGKFQAAFSPFIPFPRRAVCLYAGSQQTSTAGSAIFNL